MTDKAKSQPPKSPADKAARRADALKANLRRRKQAKADTQAQDHRPDGPVVEDPKD